MKSSDASSEAASDDQFYRVPPPQQNDLVRKLEPSWSGPAKAFADDEPLPSTSPTQASGSQQVTFKTHTETSAIRAAESRPQFPFWT
ncbi:hypothetical protein ABKV19_005936 [Rosa sericea]